MYFQKTSVIIINFVVLKDSNLKDYMTAFRIQARELNSCILICLSLETSSIILQIEEEHG